MTNNLSSHVSVQIIIQFRPFNTIAFVGLVSKINFFSRVYLFLLIRLNGSVIFVMFDYGGVAAFYGFKSYSIRSFTCCLIKSIYIFSRNDMSLELA